MVARKKNGFTLVELLIVMTIIGILVGIVIPKFTASREKAFINTVRADLRNLASLQEIYHGDEISYSGDFADLNFQPSDGVTVTVTEVTSVGWAVSASHSGSPESCALYYGQASAVSPATIPGVIACTSS